MLGEQKIEKHKRVQEYFVCVKELAIQYIVAGLKDDIINKMVLCNAKYLRHLKKFRVYNNGRKQQESKHHSNRFVLK